MKLSRNTLTLAFLAVVTLAAVAALFGHPLIPPEMLVGLGALPVAMSGEVTLSDIHDLFKENSKATGEFIKKNEDRFGKLETDMVDLAKKQGRLVLPDNGPSSSDPGKYETWLDQKSGKPVPILERHHSLVAIAGKATEAPVTLGRYLRGVLLGANATDAKQLEDERKALGGSSGTGGGFLLPDAVALDLIDLLRANQVLVQAGARTVPMENRDLTMVRLTADPAVYWHNENADLTSSEPTFGAVTLTSKTITCKITVSLELTQDAPNLDQMLSSTLVNVLATAIDSAGIKGVTGSAGSIGVGPMGIIDYAGRNRVTTIGAPTSWDFVVDGMYELMADNVPMPSIGALVAHPAVWKKMRKLKTGITSDNTPLAAPDEVAKLPKLWTTAAPLAGGSATGIIANWRDLLYGVRKEVSILPLTQTRMGSNLQVELLAYARVAFAPAREVSFCTLEGITV